MTRTWILLVNNRTSCPVEELHHVKHGLVKHRLRGKNIYWKLFVAVVSFSIQMRLNVRYIQCSRSRLDVITQRSLGRHNSYRSVLELRADLTMRNDRTKQNWEIKENDLANWRSDCRRRHIKCVCEEITLFVGMKGVFNLNVSVGVYAN